MKILLDEQLPVKLKYRFYPSLNVLTIRDMKWLGMKDSELFIKITEEHFDLFLTNDQNLKFQINKDKIDFLFVDLNFYSNRYEDLLPIIPALNDEIVQVAFLLNDPLHDKNKLYVFKNLKLVQWNNGK